MRRLTNVLVMVLSVAFVFGGGELAARVFYQHRVKTYFDAQTERGFGAPIPKKGPDEYRIFIFGGSAAYGFPVADRYSIAAWLRKNFPHLLPDKTVRMSNCGWPGKGSHHVLEGARIALKYQPDLFIIYSGHNEAPVTNRLYLDNRLYWLNMRLYFRSALYRLMTVRFNRLRKKIIYGHSGYPEKQYREEVIANKVYQRPEVTEEDYQRILKRYRENMEAVIQIAKRRHVDVLFVSLPSNLHEIPPALSIHGAGLRPEQLHQWKREFDRAGELEKEKQVQAALEGYQRAVHIDPAYAELWYRMGLLDEQLGDFESAKTAFVKARDSDAMPFRAKSSLNEVIRELTEKHGLMFVDLVRIFEGISPHGILGSDLIYDNVHPTVQAQQLIADEISRALAAHGKIAPAEAWQWQALESAREDKESEEWKVEGSVNAYRYVLRGLTLWGQRRYAEAVPDLEKGLELMPKFIESYGFLGDAYWHLGQTQKAVDLFQKLAQEDPGLFKTLLTKYPEIGQSHTESSRHPSSGSIAVHP